MILPVDFILGLAVMGAFAWFGWQRSTSHHLPGRILRAAAWGFFGFPLAILAVVGWLVVGRTARRV